VRRTRARAARRSSPSRRTSLAPARATGQRYSEERGGGITPTVLAGLPILLPHNYSVAARRGQKDSAPATGATDLHLVGEGREAHGGPGRGRHGLAECQPSEALAKPTSKHDSGWRRYRRRGGSVRLSIGGASPMTRPNELVGVDGVVPVLIEVILELGPRPERGEVAGELARREGRLGDEPRALM